MHPDLSHARATEDRGCIRVRPDDLISTERKDEDEIAYARPPSQEGGAVSVRRDGHITPPVRDTRRTGYTSKLHGIAGQNNGGAPMSKDIVQRFYEEWHKISADERSRRNSLIDRDVMAMQYVATCDSVLEIGCGTGTILALLPATRKCGVDISDTAISYATKKGIEGYVVNIDEDDLPFHDKEFKAVICIEVLEHLFDPIHALAEANRVLVDGGRLVVTIPNIGYYQYRLLHLSGKFTDFHGNGLILDEHIRFYTQESMTRIIEVCGFTVGGMRGALKISVPIPVPLGKSQHQNEVLVPRPKFNLSEMLPFATRPSRIRLLDALNILFNLWRRWPSLFAVGLVFECVKSTMPKYDWNPPVDHTRRTDEERALNVNLS